MADIAVSALGADCFHMEEELVKAQKCGIRRLHIDVCDGHFVPLFGFNPIWIKRMASLDMELDLHLMVQWTEGMLEQYLDLPVHGVTIHAESGRSGDTLSRIGRIHQAGKWAGIAVSPETPVQKIEMYLDAADEILIMTCFPGRENAAFLERSYERIREIAALIRERKHSVRIAADGGIDETRGMVCIECGAQILVMGRAFFSSDRKISMIQKIRGRGK